jgi:hypothetical protein
LALVMHRFVARARGELIGDAPWTGRVLSLHARALNILRADGLAVSVVADRISMSAMGVLATELFEAPLDTNLVDKSVTMENAVITLDHFASIDCANCPRWEGRIDPAAVRMMPAEMVHAIRNALFIHGKPGGLLDVLRGAPAGNSFVTRARKSLEEGTPEGLVGCGPGLTPSGDDFLTGAILASSTMASHMRARLERVLPGTTPAGRTLLWMALQGRFPAYLVDFMDAAARTASLDAISSAVRAACAQGETSGTDALAGFCWQMLSSPNRAA